MCKQGCDGCFRRIRREAPRGFPCRVVSSKTLKVRMSWSAAARVCARPSPGHRIADWQETPPRVCVLFPIHRRLSRARAETLFGEESWVKEGRLMSRREISDLSQHAHSSPRELPHLNCHWNEIFQSNGDFENGASIYARGEG